MRILIALLAAAFSTSALAAELTMATFNAEFLTRPKVHIKFGFPFDLSPTDTATWNAPGFRDAKFAEAVAGVAQQIG